MHLVGFYLLSACFFCAVLLAGSSLWMLYGGRGPLVRRSEQANLVFFVLLTLACGILLRALLFHDFSLVYVFGNSDRSLGLFYRITAFWAGQEGSLLFWAWAVTLCGAVFPFMSAYRSLPETTKAWYWVFYGGILAFFCLALTVWSNPFKAFTQAPADGFGLNPLLQNPGMIFHPPLLFLGYGGFTIPTCLALASAISGTLTGKDASWSERSRPLILFGWLTLSAGIILGAWWSYMELGWGGYWAWDPVENASLVPWLVGTAYLHTAIVEARRGKLARVNVLLMALTTVSAFFATYVVRGGIVQSLHTFGASEIGVPLLLFILVITFLSVVIAFAPKASGDALAEPWTREGALACVAWVLLALATLIALATTWPVISRLWSAQSMGLSADFYNRACLPLFALLGLVLCICPWLGWNGKPRSRFHLLLVVGVFAAAMVLFAVLGFRKPVALVSAAAAMAMLASLCLIVSATPGLFRQPRTLAAHAVHLGFALMVLGIAFSGPYKREERFALAAGQSVVIGGVTVRYDKLVQGDSFSHDQPDPALAEVARHSGQPRYIFIEAELTVQRDGKEQGRLFPQTRLYASRPDNFFLESDTLFTLGTEIYATLHSLDESDRAVLTVSLNPLVNWIWIGGVLLCVFPLLGMAGRRGRED